MSKPSIFGDAARKVWPAMPPTKRWETTGEFFCWKCFKIKKDKSPHECQATEQDFDPIVKSDPLESVKNEK
jgi:hypothetical protein